MKSPGASFSLAHGILPLPPPTEISDKFISDRFTASCSSLTVHLTHEPADKVLPVHEPLTLDGFPTRQHGIPVLVYHQLDNWRFVLPFSFLFAIIASMDSYKSAALAHFLEAK